MKVVELKKNKKLSVTYRNKPQLKIDDCLIKIEYCGVCSTDIYRAFDQGAYNYPLIMGHEISGIIEAVGEMSKDFVIGERVSVFPLIPCFKCYQCKIANYPLCEDYSYFGSRCDGGYSEYLAVKPWNLMKLDNSIMLEDACFMEPTAVVMHAIRLSKILDKNFGNVLIIGAGFLGLLIAEILSKKENFNLTIFDRNNFKFSKIQDKSISCISEKDLEFDYYDYIFECTGSSIGINISLNCLARNGTVCVVGNPTDNISISSNLYSKLLRKEGLIKGSWNSSFRNADHDDWLATHKEMINGLKPSQFVSHILSFEQLSVFLKNCWDHKTRKKSFKHIKGLVKI